MNVLCERLKKFFGENVIVIGLLVLYLCFMSFWEDSVERRLICPILSKFDCNLMTTIVFVLLVISLLWGCVRLVKREYIITDWMVGLAMVCGGLWAWYRFTTDVSYPLYGLSCFCYVDIIVVLVGGCIGVWIHQQIFCKPQKLEDGQVEGFIIDTPIDSRDEDLLGRRDRAEHLARKMMCTSVEKSAFTLGIVARWGEGKSSFMRMMKDYLIDRYGCDLIIMDFNPWLYGEDVHLTNVFFDELRNKLSPLNWKLARRLRHYANTLAGTNTFFDKVASYALLLFLDKNVAEQYEDLKKQVKNLSKKIVVFVDDVDRLENKEMMEVFRLVRNASNFPNMYFVMGYDKAYVIENLRGNLGYHSLSYTDKILQEEYMLPRMTDEQITNHLSNVIKRMSHLNDKDAIMFVLGKDLYHLDICQYIKNLRDVKRFENVLSVYYAKLKDEVNLRDFVLYELLRLCYPMIHNLIWSKIDDVLVESQNRMILYKKEKQEGDDERYLIDTHIDLFEYMESEQEELHLRRRDISLIKTLLKALWGEGKMPGKFAINHPQYIARYFYNSLSENDIPESEMQTLLNRPFEDMKPRLERLWQQKPIFLRGYIENVPQGKEDIKLRLRIIFYINSIAKRRVFSDATIEDMLNQLRDNHDGGYDSEVKDCFVQILLENGDMPYGLSYLARLEKDQLAIEQFPLNLVELRQLKMEVFRRYRDAHDIAEVYLVWQETHTRILCDQIDADTPGAEFIYEYNRIMQQEACRNLKEFILLTIRRSDDGKLYKLIEPWPELWRTYESYDTYIAYVVARECGDAIAIEYRRFMREYNKAGGGWVSFKFKNIQV